MSCAYIHLAICIRSIYCRLLIVLFWMPFGLYTVHVMNAVLFRWYDSMVTICFSVCISLLAFIRCIFFFVIIVWSSAKPMICVFLLLYLLSIFYVIFIFVCFGTVFKLLLIVEISHTLHRFYLSDFSWFFFEKQFCYFLYILFVFCLVEWIYFFSLRCIDVCYCFAW